MCVCACVSTVYIYQTIGRLHAAFIRHNQRPDNFSVPLSLYYTPHATNHLYNIFIGKREGGKKKKMYFFVNDFPCGDYTVQQSATFM